MFKEDAFKDIWEPWNLSHYWHIQNEIDSFHSSLELIIAESGKNLRFKTSLLSDWIEINLNSSYTSLSHALYCLWKSWDQLFTILCVRIVKLLEEFIEHLSVFTPLRERILISQASLICIILPIFFLSLCFFSQHPLFSPHF